MGDFRIVWVKIGRTLGTLKEKVFDFIIVFCLVLDVFFIFFD